MKLLLKILPIAVGLLASERALAVAYVLQSGSAVITTGNTTSTFYELHPPSSESGTASNLFSSTAGGDSTNGFWVNFSFDGNPQPILTSAFLKASNRYLWWDSSDLAAFNSGTYTSITLWNAGPGGLWNPPANNLQGTSHAGINGRLGTPRNNVPDGGTSALLLGISLLGLGAAKRWKA